MSNPKQVYRSRQLHLRMPPIAIGKDPQLAGVHEFLDPFLNIAEIAGRTFGPIGYTLGDLRCFGRIGTQCAYDIDPIQSVQMVKMHSVIVHIQGAFHDIAHKLGIRRDCDP